jgi:hypothetical protein
VHKAVIGVNLEVLTKRSATHCVTSQGKHLGVFVFTEDRQFKRQLSGPF